jgi:hypothetical protein
VERIGFLLNDTGTDLTRVKKEEPDLIIDLDDRTVEWTSGDIVFVLSFSELFTVTSKIRALAKMKKVKE